MSREKIGMRIGESVFCVGYLFFVFISGIIFFINSANIRFLIYGIMSAVLLTGDAFHLIPRVINNIKGDSEKVRWWMNLGLLISSITMTIFYLIMFYLWKYTNPSVRYINLIPIVIWTTCILRIIICLLPQNKWFSGGNFKLSICRNLIFCITGYVSMLLFLIQGLWFGQVMAICILLSFCFYMPVALFAKENPKLGLLMIPKTIMYMIILGLGLFLI